MNIQDLKCTVAQVSDAQKGFGTAAIFPLQDTMKVCGYARTVWTAAGNVGYYDALLQRIQPGDVVVIDGQGEGNVASFETNRIAELKAAGAAGVIVFGATTTHSDDSFPTFSLSVHPRIGCKSEQYYLGRPVAIDGVPVCEGDFVYGTGDGLVFVAQEQTETILSSIKGDV